FMEGHAAALGISPAALTEKMNSSVPLGRWVEPHEVAGLAVYLASDESSYINGQAWTVDGGYTTI
ncbi:MAG: SDR family oxidoreductase, partial [Proteobacteria bacterium]|nr:SDR family oxidoreductase [Pseudomonadota bacterium]